MLVVCACVCVFTCVCVFVLAHNWPGDYHETLEGWLLHYFLPSLFLETNSNDQHLLTKLHTHTRTYTHSNCGHIITETREAHTHCSTIVQIYEYIQMEKAAECLFDFYTCESAHRHKSSSFLSY